MILGLDISTSCVGVSLFSQTGDLVFANRISPKSPKSITNNNTILSHKANVIKDYLITKLSNYDIKEIVIEEPMISSNNKYTIATLLKFNGMISYIVTGLYNVEANYIESGLAREHALPETNGYRVSPKGKVSKKKSRFGALPLKIANEKINKKAVVLHQIALRYPDIKWNINRNMSLAVENYDVADAITVVLGYKNMIGDWTPTVQPIDKLINFITHLAAYKNLTKKLKEQKAKGQITQIEINDLREEYIKNSFGIDNYINVNW